MSEPDYVELYRHYDVINDEGSTAEQKEKSYRAVLLATSGGPQEKRLASQFIVTFSKRFENLKEESFSSLLDLCDDDHIDTRKQAVHDLQALCKQDKSYIPRVADIYVQMFNADDTTEMQVISLALTQILNLDVKSTLVGMFNRLLTQNPENPREHVIKFLADRLKQLPDTLLTSEVEEFVIEQTNKMLRDVSEEEFHHIISVLSSLRSMSSVVGRQKLVYMITEQALQAVPEFQPLDVSCVAQIRESGKQAANFVSKNVHAHELLLYLLDKVMPRLLEIPEASADQLTLLRVGAQLSTHLGTNFSAVALELDQRLSDLYRIFMHFLPEVPSESSSEKNCPELINSASKEDKLLNLPGLKLSELECLLCMLHNLGRFRPQFFGGSSSTEDSVSEDVTKGTERLRVIRPRLQFLAQVAQEYAQLLANQLSPTTAQNAADESKLKVVAHRVMSNIQSFIRCFFRNPPSFKPLVITLSWLPQSLAGEKRFLPADLAAPTTTESRLARREQPRYTPPIGQWSQRGNTGRWQAGNRGFYRRGRGRTNW